MQNFLPFIAYCSYQASRYFTLAKVLKMTRMKEPLVFSEVHNRRDGSSIEYSLTYSMPGAEDFGKVADLCAKAAVLTARTEVETISITFNLEDSMVCETSIRFSLSIGEYTKVFSNNFYEGTEIHRKFSKEYMLELIEAVEEIRLLYIAFYLKMGKLETIMAEPGLLILPFDGFCFAEGNIM